jgi:hypothetical protein
MKRITDTNTFDRAAEIFVSSVNPILEENVPGSLRMLRDSEQENLLSSEQISLENETA